MLNIFDNPIGRMYGPQFLFFYAIVAVLIILFILYVAPEIVIRENDNDKGLKIPKTPDPYEIAYLQGADGGVVQLALVSLVSRGYFKILKNEGTSRLRLTKIASEEKRNLLTPIEKAVYDSINSGDLERTLMDKKHESAIGSITTKFKSNLDKENLLWGAREDNLFSAIKITCAIIFVGLGAYKLMAALDHGHKNFFFLFAFGIGGFAIMSKLNSSCNTSSKGKALLKQLKTVFRSIKGNDLFQQPAYMQNLLVSLYGIELLDGSKHSYLSEFITRRIGSMYKRKFSDHSSSGGGSWGGTSGCGGGCGSSCGGGCGGGCGGCS